ncbi:MAG: type II toxin-antitoxin system VapC family toxin [Patescibacteria group bacterium]|nr:type II toxin-antitoxin system VapC family toxin [Patescibacteria group bacterium]
MTSTHVLINVAHRLMTIEAMVAYGWPASGIAYRLQRHSDEVQKLTAFRRSVEQVPALGIHVLPVTLDQVVSATGISQRNGLLSGDALLVAALHAHRLTHLASHDADFDKVPGIKRYAPAL